MVRVSVPGKVHLLGEHAVVYGHPALLSAVNLRLTVTLEDSTETTIQATEPPEGVSHALSVVRQELQLRKLPPMAVTVTSDIPAGYHLGSSAAVAVGIAAAVVYRVKKLWNPEQINRIAYEIEKKQHGTPSGGDNTAVVFGGFLWYRKELEFLRSLWKLPFPFPRSLHHFFLIDTGRPRETTGDMVALVASKVRTAPGAMHALFAANETEVKRLAVAIKTGNPDELIDAIRKGERTLEAMGVVSRKAVSLIRAVERSGGAAKILGGGGVAGGTGYLLAYHDEGARLESVTERLGAHMRPVMLGEEGVRLEQKE